MPREIPADAYNPDGSINWFHESFDPDRCPNCGKQMEDEWQAACSEECWKQLEAELDAVEVSPDIVAAVEKIDIDAIIRESNERAERMRRRNQHVARIVREQDGTELTPDEVGEFRREAFKKIRAELRKKKIWVPSDDLEMAEYLDRIMKEARDEQA